MNEFDFRVIETFGLNNQLKYKRYLNPEGIQTALSSKNGKDISDFLLLGFYWRETPQGHDFWNSMYSSVRREDFRLWGEKGRPLFEALFSLESVPSVEEML